MADKVRFRDDIGHTINERFTHLGTTWLKEHLGCDKRTFIKAFGEGVGSNTMKECVAKLNDYAPELQIAMHLHVERVPGSTSDSSEDLELEELAYKELRSGSRIDDQGKTKVSDISADESPKDGPKVSEEFPMHATEGREPSIVASASVAPILVKHGKQLNSKLWAIAAACGFVLLCCGFFYSALISNAKFKATRERQAAIERDVQAIVDRVISEDAESLNRELPFLLEHRETAVRQLEAVLARTTNPNWNDAPVNPDWVAPEASIIAIESAHGVLSERFVFVVDMTLDEFFRQSEILRGGGYRPIRIRPFLQQNSKKQSEGGKVGSPPATLLSAIWIRDGKKWLIETDVTESSLPIIQKSAERDGLVFSDVGCLPSTTPESGPTFMVLFSEPEFELEKRKMILNASMDEIENGRAEREKEGFRSQLVIHLGKTSSGKVYYGGIWSNAKLWSRFRSEGNGMEIIDLPIWDLSTTHRELDSTSQKDAPGIQDAMLWRADTTVESTLVDVDIADAPTTIRQLNDQGYRPQSIAADGVSRVKILLHKPLVPEASKEIRASQVAKAAVALMRLKATDRVWPILKDSPDNRAQSLLLYLLTSCDVDPALLLDRLASEIDATCQRSLILSLGEYAKKKLLSFAQCETLVNDLQWKYRNSPDSGVHSASEWTLRQLGSDEATKALPIVKGDHSTGYPSGGRKWYWTKTGSNTNNSLSLTIVPMTEEYLMGSPFREADRQLGAESSREFQHRQAIGYSFAIGTHEVTISQFLAFRPTHKYDREMAKVDDAPANAVSWFEAAEYCNWLSEQEGIARSEWCYEPADTSGGDFGPSKDSSTRLGYRLPTEAEWEYACRSGTLTSRHFGENDTLLREYAWYAENSGNKYLLPVGSLKPNGIGLFDTLGNTMEWCHDHFVNFATSEEKFESKILRGGSASYAQRNVRSAYRGSQEPNTRSGIIGFRVARRMP